ncbi:MAG TPA: hypothetical protein VMS12_06505, partial [Thermoanaerobaculia bacterium]|nr:hypothetical protein [Thermoanaerobaculia bacterium]
KPELRIVPELARFFETATPWLDDFEPAEVIVVVPHSRLFLNRPAATDGFRRMIRVLAERFGVVPSAISELTLTSERLREARLVIVPSPEFLDGNAAASLVDASRSGTKILVTGVVTGDPYGEIPPALRALGIVDEGRPVTMHEATRWSRSDAPGFATFDRNLQESLRRSLAPPLETLDDTIWHEPLPLEHAREEGPLVALLEASLMAAGVETSSAEGGVAASILRTGRSILVVVVNETSEDSVRRVTMDGRTIGIPVKAGRSRLVLFEKESGRIIAQTTGEEPTD